MILFSLLLSPLLAALPVAAQTVVIEASRDATLIEHPDGALANGAGPLFAGRTAQGTNGVRRALLHFDVAGALPANAIVTGARLILYVTPSNAEAREHRLHRVLADWGEGPSFSSGGRGAPSEPGDATWLHAFYDWEFWTHQGGQFVGGPSARLDLGGSGFYTWTGTRRLVNDVRRWQAAPQRNFGWILIGDETTSQSVKSIASRENADPTLRPALEVTYRTRGGSGRPLAEWPARE